jgi:hypothetical protein
MEVALFWPSILFVIGILFLLVLNEMVLVLENTLYECEWVFGRVSAPRLTVKRISKDASTTMR